MILVFEIVWWVDNWFLRMGIGGIKSVLCFGCCLVKLNLFVSDDVVGDM